MGRKLIVVSNRGPLRRVKVGGRRRWERSAGGLVTALDPMLRSRESVWVAFQEAEDVESVGVEEAGLGYGMGSVALSRSVQQGFYEGVSNAVLWPLMHSFPTTIRIGTAPWDVYVAANRAFCDGVLRKTGEDDIVWVHDYHLMLLPGLLRKQRPHLRIGWFCHIPWPSSDLFGILPWRRDILGGLLEADLLGLHTDDYVENFLDCIRRFTDYEVDFEQRIVRKPGGAITRVIAAPIGIAVRELEAVASDPRIVVKASQLQQSVGRRQILLGVDRLDYTKGIPERLLAYEQLLKRDRQARNRYALVQIMVPSRTDVEAYAALKMEIDGLVGHINGRFSATGQVPIHYLYRNLDRETLYAHYRAASVALVTPLRDGMNLVAQEYALSRMDDTGALVLSEFAGAARYMKGAYLVNPYDMTAIADAADRALHEKPDEMRERMRSMREAVRMLDVHAWADNYLHALEDA